MLSQTLKTFTLLVILTTAACVCNRHQVGGRETDSPVAGTGEIDVFHVELPVGTLVPLHSYLSSNSRQAQRDKYVSLILHNAYLVDLPEVFGSREYRISFVVKMGDKTASRLLDGVFEPPARLNFRDFSLIEDVVWTGKPINIRMDIIELDEQAKDEWKRYVDLAGGILGIGAKAFFPGGDTLTTVARAVVEHTTKNDEYQFPFDITLHESEAGNINAVSPLLDSKYVFARLRTSSNDQVWTPDEFVRKVRLTSNGLRNGATEFRDRSFMVVTVRLRDKRASYSDEAYFKDYRKALGLLAQVSDLARDERSISRAMAALDDALEKLGTLHGVLTQRDIDARTYFFSAVRDAWLAASTKCDPAGTEPHCRQATRSYLRNAIDSYLRIPEGSLPADDIIADRLINLRNYLCHQDTDNFLTKEDIRDHKDKLCIKRGKMSPDEILVATSHLTRPPINPPREEQQSDFPRIEEHPSERPTHPRTDQPDIKKNYREELRQREREEERITPGGPSTSPRRTDEGRRIE